MGCSRRFSVRKTEIVNKYNVKLEKIARRPYKNRYLYAALHSVKTTDAFEVRTPTFILS